MTWFEIDADNFRRRFRAELSLKYPNPTPEQKIWLERQVQSYTHKHLKQSLENHRFVATKVSLYFTKSAAIPEPIHQFAIAQ